MNELEQLKEIRSMMERSTKFISLSGLSGIFAGSVALAGATVQYIYLAGNSGGRTQAANFDPFVADKVMWVSLANFMAILVVALAGAYYFTSRKASKNKQSVWDRSSQRLMMNMAVPLFCGGLFCAVLYYYGFIGLIAPASLIFYGLSLVSGSNFTLDDIRYLGITQIVLGFTAAFFIGYGLLFWAVGFGFMHILYGGVMYFKYDKKEQID